MRGEATTDDALRRILGHIRKLHCSCRTETIIFTTLPSVPKYSTVHVFRLRSRCKHVDLDRSHNHFPIRELCFAFAIMAQQRTIVSCMYSSITLVQRPTLPSLCSHHRSLGPLVSYWTKQHVEMTKRKARTSRRNTSFSILGNVRSCSSLQTRLSNNQSSLTREAQQPSDGSGYGLMPFQNVRIP